MSDTATISSAAKDALVTSGELGPAVTSTGTKATSGTARSAFLNRYSQPRKLRTSSPRLEQNSTCDCPERSNALTIAAHSARLFRARMGGASSPATAAGTQQRARYAGRIRTEVALLAAQVTECPPALSSVAAGPFPPGLEAAIARALAKDPADRFASVEDFGRALCEPDADARRRLRALANVTEKMPGGTWSAARGTAPLDASVFRPARKALPFIETSAEKPTRAASIEMAAAADAAPPPNASSAEATTPTPTRTAARTPAPRSAPSFGLPPAPKAPAAPAPAPATPTGLSLASALQGNRLLFGAVVAVWCLLAVMLWRVL